MFYPCSGNEPEFDDIQLLDAAGNVVNPRILASECFANWYVSTHGGSWRHAPDESAPLTIEGE